MLLHRLRLIHFRGVADRTVDLIAPGVTVVAGPNEAGKSSMLEALDLLFRYADDSKSTALRQVQPAGRDVPTTVEAELTLGSGRYRYRKTWFTDRGTSWTTVAEPGTGAEASLTGRAAHDEARRVFEEFVDPHLWDALVVGQSRSLQAPRAQDVPSVLSALSAESDGGGGEPGPVSALALAETEGSALAGRVEREYTRFYTPGRGEPTGEYAAAEKERAAAETALAEADRQLGQVAEEVARAEQLERERADHAARLRAAGEDVAELRAELERRTRAAEQRDLVDQVVAGAQESARSAAERARLRDRAIAHVQALAADLAEVVAAVDDDTAAADQARGVVRAADEAAAAAAAAAERARHRAERASAYSRWRRDQEELDALVRRVATVREALRAEERARADVESTASLPGPEILTQAQRLSTEARVARETAVAQTSPVRLRRLGPGEVAVDHDGHDHRLDQQPLELVPVDHAVTIVAGDLVEITVAPPQQSEARARAAEAGARLQALLRESGADDLAQLSAAVERRQAARATLAEASRVTTAALGGARGLDDLDRRRDALTASLEKVLAELEAIGVDLGQPPGPHGDEAADDAEQPSLFAVTPAGREPAAAAAEDPDAAAAEAAAAERRRDVAAEAAQRARADVASLQTRISHARQRADDLTRRHAEAAAELAEQRSEIDDARVLAEADRTRREARSARERQRDTGGDDAAALDEVRARYEKASRSLARLQRLAKEVEADLNRCLGRLDDAGSRGVASGRDVAAAAFAAADERYRHLRRRAEAARLLRETLAEHRAAARRDYAAPLREAIVALGRQVFAPDFDVSLSGDLDVATRTCDGVTLPLAQLSTGAREQVAILVRLAIASLTSRDGQGVPVILDDALGWSDQERLASMARLLADAGTHTQVVLLTSQPQRYALPGVRVVTVGADGPESPVASPG